MKKKPIKRADMTMLMTDIKANHAACDVGDSDRSFFTFGQVDWSVNRLIEDGHAVVYKVWPLSKCAEVRELIVDGIPVVKNGELLDAFGIFHPNNDEKG